MEQTILYYDGLCVLCNKSVRFIISRDRKNQFKIGFLDELKNQDKQDSVVLVHNGIKYNYYNKIVKERTWANNSIKINQVIFDVY